MAKSTKSSQVKLSDQEQVTRHIQGLDPGVGEIVEAIRQVVLSADKEVGEQIKWNGPWKGTIKMGGGWRWWRNKVPVQAGTSCI